jgi:hypothetical protein
MKFVRIIAIAALVAGAAQLTGCASITMSQPKASVETTAKLRGAHAAPVALGSFKLDAGKSAGMDKSMSVRGANSISSPIEGSFAKYLGETLKVELEAAGLLDPASAVNVSGTLTQSELDPAIGTGTGSLAARFVVQRAGKVNFDRELKVSSEWESSFMGAVAIPAAAGGYEGLYRKLVSALIDDQDFRKAIAK